MANTNHLLQSKLLERISKHCNKIFAYDNVQLRHRIIIAIINSISALQEYIFVQLVE